MADKALNMVLNANIELYAYIEHHTSLSTPSLGRYKELSRANRCISTYINALPAFLLLL